jgi:nucleoside-diphosphate-sugar epimerase
MTRTQVSPVLVTGATGRVGRAVVDLLLDAGVPVRALAHRSEAAATLPANVEVVTGDLTVPESLRSRGHWRVVECRVEMRRAERLTGSRPDVKCS